LFIDLAGKLGRPLEPGASRSDAWRQLVDAVRLCHWQRQSVVLAVDDAHQLAGEREGASELERLGQLGQSARVTVIVVGRSDVADALAAGASDRWELAIRLKPLTRSEAALYVSSRLAAAGRDAFAFTDRAITRLHALAAGWPRGLNRLGSLALMAGALRGIEVVTPDVVEASALECAAIDSSREPLAKY
jgi:type II secretory pathway predicted ATPase ExeA